MQVIAEGQRKVVVNLDVKLEMLRQFEVGEKKICQILKALGLAMSTVGIIHDMKDK